MKLDFHFLNGGRFVSRGRGLHPERVIDSIEIIYVLSGRLGIAEEGIVFDLVPGDFLLLRPGRRHVGTMPYPADLSFFWGHFSGPVRKMEALPQTGRVARPEHCALFFEQLLNESAADNDAVSCDLLLALLLHEITMPNRAADHGKHLELAEEAWQYMRLHFAEPVSIASAAAELRCNAAYLGRLFQRNFGQSFADALNDLRLKKAAAMLAGTSCSIKEVLFSCGFSDPAYFRRRFFRKYAMRPSEYRQLHAKIHVNTE